MPVYYGLEGFEGPVFALRFTGSGPGLRSLAEASRHWREVRLAVFVDRLEVRRFFGGLNKA